MPEVKHSIYSYIKAVQRYYLNTVIVLFLLLGASYLTLDTALERHLLQQNISFLTSKQFVHFQQLSNRIRALIRASADENMTAYIVAPMVDDIRESIASMKAMQSMQSQLSQQISRNLLERWRTPDASIYASRHELDTELNLFIKRIEHILDATIAQRRTHYSFWGTIDFSLPLDSKLNGLFREMLEHTYHRSDLSINNARVISSMLLASMAAILLFASFRLFLPLIRKLRAEHDVVENYQQQLVQLVNTDALTGLSNRHCFNEKVRDCFEVAEKRGDPFSLMLIDINNFKSVNDHFGHPAGDATLQHVASILQSCIPTNALVARLGGDEFAVILPNISNTSVLYELSAAIARQLALGLIYEQHELRVSATIGIAIAPIHGRDQSTLIKAVDLALYGAKHSQKDVLVFEPTTLEDDLEKSERLSELAHAAERGEYVVHYQPKLSFLTGEVCGAEALVRWQHPELGLLMPGQFLPLMAGSSLFFQMTQTIIRTVGKDIAEWKRNGLFSGPVSINFPESLLLSLDGYHYMKTVIQEYQLEWQDFVIEVTEDVFLDSESERIHNVVNQFRESNVRVSLDDFGTGFASLVHLRDFPFDELKIDRSFVSCIGQDLVSEQIIYTMIDLARNLNKQCVAEGIETEEQNLFLQQAGCHIGQGYLFSKPIPYTEMSEYLSTQRAIKFGDKANEA